MAVVRSFNSYDVFLNFRGEDTRKTFAHKLYVALVQGGLSTFRDEDMMDKGENLKSELEKAIRQSKSSIVVIFKDYSSSTWCLDELVLILEQRRTYRHIVLPVFYDVDPSHVRKQSGRIAEAFARYEEQFEAETDSSRKRKLMKKIKGWKSALTEVGYLNGLDLQNHVDGHESKFIKKIIKIISDKLIQSTVVLKIRLHCEECNGKIKRILSKINGVEKFILDPRKDLVTIVGRVDMKELVLYLEEKLKRSVYVISITKKDDKDGENKEKEGDKKDKDNVGDKEEKESSGGSGGGGGGGGGKKENKMEYYGYNPNTYTIPKYHQSEKKGKESGGGGGGGKKENKLEYSQYNPNTNTNMKPVYHQSDKNEKESANVDGKKKNEMEYHWYNHTTYTMPVYHESYKKEKECGRKSGRKDNKLKYSEYSINTYTIPVYHQSYVGHDYTGTSHHYNQDYSAMFSDDNPNACSMM